MAIQDDKVKLTSLGMYEARAKDFCAEDPQNYSVENKHLVQLEITKTFPLLFEDMFTPCLNACINYLPKLVNTLFNNMFKLCLNTRL